MACATTDCDMKKTIEHAFRCVQSDQVLSFTQAKLERVPYLDALASNKDNFVCNLTADNTFVLDPNIQYIYLNSIHSAIVHEKASLLFTTLPRHADVFSMLDLYDYLCIDALPVPSLQPIPESRWYLLTSFFDEYHRASLSEARDTAVEFVLAIANGKYDLNNLETRKTIFNLLIDILSFPSVFGQRLRYQTLMIVEHCCSAIFTAEQHHLLRAYKQSLEMLDDSEPDPNVSSQLLQAPDIHIFYWRRNTFSHPPSRSLFFTCYEMLKNMGTSVRHDLRSFPFDSFDCERCFGDRFLRYRYFSIAWPLDLSATCIGHAKSCSCGFLPSWTKAKSPAERTKRLRILCNCYHDDFSDLRHIDLKTAMCLMNCCIRPSNAKEKHERRLIHSGRSYHLLSPPTVDKFKNKSNMKTIKHL